MKPNPIKSLGRTNADRLVSVTAIIVSAGTLFLFIYQTNLLRKEQKASVMPYLQIGLGNNGDRSFLHLSNDGPGPAFIDSAIIRYKGKKYPGDPRIFYRQFTSDSSSLKSLQKLERFDTLKNWPLADYADRLHPGRLIASGEGMKMLGVTGNSLQLLAFNGLFYSDKIYGQNMKFEMQPARLRVYYHSVYDDRWMASSHRISPIKLED